MKKILFIITLCSVFTYPIATNAYNSYCVQSALRQREQGVVALLQERNMHFIESRQQLLEGLLDAAGQLSVSARAQSRIKAWNDYLTDMRQVQESYTTSNAALFESYRTTVAQCDTSGELFE